jgi:hypothetical protein
VEGTKIAYLGNGERAAERVGRLVRAVLSRALFTLSRYQVILLTLKVRNGKDQADAVIKKNTG